MPRRLVEMVYARRPAEVDEMVDEWGLAEEDEVVSHRPAEAEEVDARRPAEEDDEVVAVGGWSRRSEV